MTTTTRERPVILTPAEHREALAGTLGAIERAVNPQPQEDFSVDYTADDGTVRRRNYGTVWAPRIDGPWYNLAHSMILNASPFGAPGTVLLVKETIRVSFRFEGYGIVYRADDTYRSLTGDAIQGIPACESEAAQWVQDQWDNCADRWRPASRMPAWAARLFLENLAVSVVQVDGEWRWRVEVRQVDGEGSAAT